MMKRLFLLVGLLLGFAASVLAETKTDTLYFEFELDDGVASAKMCFFMRVDGISIEYNDGQEHNRIYLNSWFPSSIIVNGNGYMRIYYPHEQSTGYRAALTRFLRGNDFEDENTRALIMVYPASPYAYPYNDDVSPVHITSLDVSGCTSLTELRCSNNQLTSLDVSGCTTLTSLSCYGNRLTSLDVSKNTALTSLSCHGNRLTSLDVSKNTALTWLNCDGNQLTSLDVSGCTALKTLYCNNNYKLTSLDVRGLTALETLYCYDNRLTELNTSGCTALTTLKIIDSRYVGYDNDSLSILNTSGCTSLKEFELPERLTSLDASGCTSLTKLDLYRKDSLLTSLNVSGCTALTGLGCYGGQLTSLDMSGCTALTGLWCSNNQLTELDVSGLTSLAKLWCENNRLTRLDVSGLTALETLYCGNNPLTSLDASGCTSLTNLSFYENDSLTILNVSGCTSLTELRCYNNQLTELDVSGCTSLTELSCGYTQLTTLDVSGLTALETLYCSNNQLTSLDVSGCTSLTELECYNNRLMTLDMSGCTSLTKLECSNNQLTSLDVSSLTSLTELSCGYNQLTTLDVSGLTSLTKLWCNDNHIPLSLLYNIYNLSSDWEYFYAYHQSDSISLLIEQPWDLSSERIIGSTVSDYSLYSEKYYSVSDYLYTEKEFLFQFHNHSNCYQLTLKNESILNGTFTWYISVELPDGYYEIRVSSGSGGFATGDGIYQEGEEVTITATPCSVCSFVNWTKADGSVFSTEAEYTFTVTENLELMANFGSALFFTVNLYTNNPNWGYVSMYNATYQEGTEATITAYPYSGYRFVNWTKADGSVFSTEERYTFTVMEDLELTANFEEISEDETFAVRLFANNPAWGYVTPNYYDTYKAGQQVTIIATPYRGYRFVNWTKADGSVFSTQAEYTFSIMEDLELTANFVSDNVGNENREDDNFAVYVQDRTIYLSEPRGRVQVFNTTGQCVYNGVSSVIPMHQSGIYIVMVSGRSYKVVVW